MKNNNHKKFDKKKLIGTISKKHIKNGSYTMVMSVIFIAVVVVLNMIVNAIPSKYSEIDISSQKLYSIGDDTKAMLKDLDKDVTIYQIAQSGSEDENVSVQSLCWLTGHNLTSDNVAEVKHKVSKTAPRCYKTIYQVDTCSKCDYMETTVLNQAFIDCCAED